MLDAIKPSESVTASPRHARRKTFIPFVLGCYPRFELPGKLDGPAMQLLMCRMLVFFSTPTMLRSLPRALGRGSDTLFCALSFAAEGVDESRRGRITKADVLSLPSMPQIRNAYQNASASKQL